MPLTRLAEFYDRIPDAVPEHHQKRPVKWLIHLDGAGRFLQFISTVGEGGRATEYVVPYRRRSGTKPPPYLLADTPAYVLGLGLDKMTNEAAAERRRDFAALVEECAETCGAAALRAVASFVAADPPAPPADLAAGDTLTFVVDGELVTALPEVRAFWQERQSAEPEDGAGLVAECLLCGQTRPIAKRHPVELRLARDRVQIITANANAFESFGLEASEIAPICLPCALRYGQAARYLMTSKEHHYQAGGLHYVYWTRSGGHGGLFSILQDPQPEQVEALLQAAFHSRAAPGVDHDAFYAFSATSNTGRLVIRDWLETTVGEVKEHLGRWFAGQELVGGRGEASEPIGLYALAGSLVRKDARNKPKLDDLPPQALPALVGAALFGRRLPVWLLHQAIRRCHAEQQLTRPRAALVKMVLNSVPESERRVPLMTASLDHDNHESAYLCGRLFALLEEAQRRAIPGLNATIADRFFGTAGSAPASVFPRLMRGAKNHLSKLAGVERTRGAAIAIERRIEEVAAGLRGFPTVLTMVEQGQFLLGYYHQRADDRAAATEHKQAAQAAANADES